MNLANKMTMARVVMIPIFLVLLYWDFKGHLYAALAVFILASVTDTIDGYVARHYNMIPAWAFFVVIAREFAVTGLRLIAVEHGRVIAAGKSGKVKTASTMVCICLMLAIPNATLRLVCWIVILATTIYSGIEYFVQNRDVLLSGEM